MSENSYTGFSHVMCSSSQHAWTDDLYQGVSEKIPSDIIAEIFGSVSTNVKNLKINSKLCCGTMFCHNGESLDTNDFRRLLRWHNTDAITDKTIR